MNTNKDDTASYTLMQNCRGAELCLSDTLEIWLDAGSPTPARPSHR